MKKEEINELIEPLNSENYLQLRNVSQLKRLPWIGRNYINNEPKVLILGDTHYAINMDGSFSEEGYQEFMQEESTINIVKCALEEGPWSFFSGLHRLFHLTNDNDLKKFWSNVAFYNFVQEVMHSKDSIPSDDNFSEAWICFCDVIDIINPDFCLFLGVRSETAIASIIECCGGNYFIQNGMEKCNGVFPRYGEIETKNGTKTRFIAIKHPSKYFSHEEWNKFLYHEEPIVMSLLDEE